MADTIYSQIVKTGKVTRGWLGVTIQSMTPELAKSYNLPPDKGVLVADVQSGTPAAKAGLQSGDIVLEYNGKELHSNNDLSLAVAATKVGDPANLKILRNGKEMSLEVKVGERPAEVSENFPASTSSQQKGKLGLTVENITPEVARQMNLSSTVGALVTEVRPDGPAADAGVRPGDIIRALNNTNVSSASDLVQATQSLQSGDSVRLRITRNGQNLYLAFEIS
jgi:serine protease Do